MKHRELKQPKHIKLPLLSIIAGCLVLLVFLGTILYNVIDNQRFVLVEQEIYVDELPASFDGFRILQISDLHGRSFGKKQADLIEFINQLDYDMVALTGDMCNRPQFIDPMVRLQPMIDLLDGMENRDYVFWVDGNSTPFAAEKNYEALTGELTETGSFLQQKGVIVLILPYPITRGEDRIWITPEMSETLFDQVYRRRLLIDELNQESELEKQIQAFYKKAYAAYNEINGNGEVKIMLTHIPVRTNLSQEEIKKRGELDYSLILAGHNHGGQWRLPWIGALYIPSQTSGIFNSGLFPSQETVKGVSYYGNIPQYISAGLGAGGPFPLQFRIFDTPEINLIILKRPQ